MSNKIYLWGDKSSINKEYASIISFTMDELVIRARFGDLAQYMSLRDNNLIYKDFLSSDDAISLIVNILHSFQRDSDRTFFTVDVSSRSYLKMMAFFENIAFKNTTFPKEKRLEVLDSVYDCLDKSVVNNIPNYKDPSFQRICDTIIDVVKSVEPSCVELVIHSLGQIDKSTVIPEILFSDLFFDMTILTTWLINHTKHIHKENAYRIVMFPDLEQTMKAILTVLQKNKTVDFGGNIILDKASDSVYVKAVGSFLAIISDLFQSLLNRDDSNDSNLDPQFVKRENLLLNEVWKTFHKEGSIWMTSPMTNKKLMGYLNR